MELEELLTFLDILVVLVSVSVILDLSWWPSDPAFPQFPVCRLFIFLALLGRLLPFNLIKPVSMSVRPSICRSQKVFQI